jgi:hypothetical protein
LYLINVTVDCVSSSQSRDYVHLVCGLVGGRYCLEPGFHVLFNF